MKAVAAAGALAALIVSPAFAEPARSARMDAAFQSNAQAPGERQRVVKKKAQRVSTTGVVARAYSRHPEYDVYVNGEYAGSDPDPRIRWTIRQEYKGRFGLRN